MNERSYKRVKLACYATSASMSAVSNLAPILFLGFHDLYDISFVMLGLLVLVNFSTQLIVDLMLAFFSHKINTGMAVKLTPVLIALGLLVFALAPVMFPTAPFIGLLIGTVIYSAGGGFVEVLISPVVAAIPADDPEREVSKLHSIYAWGVVVIVPLCSLMIMLFGSGCWQILALACMAIPITAALLFLGTKLPPLTSPERVSGVLGYMKSPTLWICVIAIFLGGAGECIMSQWASTYIEGALGIEKIYGDIFGVTMFAVMLGIGRTLYSKYGSCPERVLMLSAIGATVCYLTAALSPSPVVGLVACALCGLCASMLWPGSLLIAAERIPTAGVMIYALMAAGGDLGASVGPQLVGVIADTLGAQPALSESLGMTPDELGLKAGMLIGAIFTIAAVAVFAVLLRTKKPKNANK